MEDLEQTRRLKCCLMSSLTSGEVSILHCGDPEVLNLSLQLANCCQDSTNTGFHISLPSQLISCSVLQMNLLLCHSNVADSKERWPKPDCEMGFFGQLETACMLQAGHPYLRQWRIPSKTLKEGQNEDIDLFSGRITTLYAGHFVCLLVQHALTD